MSYKYSKVIALGLTAIILLWSPVASIAKTSDDELSPFKTKIPTQMNPGTILKYDENIKPSITYDTSKIVTSSESIPTSVSISNREVLNEVVDKKGRVAEDAFFEAVAQEAKELGLPKINLGFDLPNPEPGLVVIYGSDGRINRYYNELNLDTLSEIPTTTVPYPGRLSPGVYEYGKDQKITITSGAVTGEGRFTVFRSGVGGSGSVGSSGKILEAGDVATKRQIDNAKHNTSLTARALDTDIVKTVYKNDIGSLPDAVLDVYFWGWNNVMFGYEYSDTLSFAGRYYYQY